MLRIMDKKIYGLIDLRFGGSLNRHVYMYFVNVDRKGFSKIGWMQTFILAEQSSSAEALLLILVLSSLICKLFFK